MPLMSWKEAYNLGVAAMDETHREFMDWLNRLEALSDTEFPAGLAGFIEHTQAHFDQEQRWMTATGFPPISCHEDEHNRVLEVARQVQAMVAKGDVAIGRRLVEEMVPWFDQHAATMDDALAFWIKQQGYLAERGEEASVAH